MLYLLYYVDWDYCWFVFRLCGLWPKIAEGLVVPFSGLYTSKMGANPLADAIIFKDLGVANKIFRLEYSYPT